MVYYLFSSIGARPETFPPMDTILMNRQVPPKAGTCQFLRQRTEYEPERVVSYMSTPELLKPRA